MNINIIKLTALSFVVTMVLAGCKKSQSTSLDKVVAIVKGQYQLTAKDSAQVDASNEFGLDVLRFLMKKEPQKSTVISPSGIRYILSMLACGADGSTLTDLQRAIGATNVDLNNVNKFNRRIIINQ